MNKTESRGNLMHSIITILCVGLIIAAGSLLFAKLKAKGHFVSGKTKNIPTLIIFLFVLLALLVPADSFALSFLPVEQQLDYYMDEPVDCVVQGEKSAIGISFEDDTPEVTFIDKTLFLWRPAFSDSARYYYKKVPASSVFPKYEYRVAVFSTLVTKEKYVAVSFASADAVAVTTAQQSAFVRVDHAENQQYACSYVACVGKSFDLQSLFINGESANVN